MLLLYFVHYNFCRVHGSLRMSPATAGGRVRYAEGHRMDRRADRRTGTEAHAASDLPPPGDFKLRHYLPEAPLDRLRVTL